MRVNSKCYLIRHPPFAGFVEAKIASFGGCWQCHPPARRLSRFQDCDTGAKGAGNAGLIGVKAHFSLGAGPARNNTSALRPARRLVSGRSLTGSGNARVRKKLPVLQGSA